MNPGTKPLDPLLASAVNDQLIDDEFIVSWRMDDQLGEIHVRLIRRQLHEECQRRSKGASRGAGYGRSLTFRLDDGKWTLAGRGGWLS
ncbi:MAG: hypothetical protein JNG89_05705 [Planctomycetaceae bacterium]|nr:hypothetical protein [Planctomycetaceae bacterium]